jgi:hypothetical protein
LHRANRVAVNLGNSFRIFKEGEQTVAAHVEKIMGNVGVGRRTAPSTWQLQIEGKRDRLSDARRYA